MSRSKFYGLVTFLAAICASVAVADAQEYGYPGYWGCCAESVPYFAVHPPVYYSLAIPRTYGYSPFPYPPGVLTPGSDPSRAWATARYINNRSETGGEEEMAFRPRRPTPLTIDNPFVAQPGKPMANGLSKRRQPAPQVVYPALLADLSIKSR
jgi:hypothetical protein